MAFRIIQPNYISGATPSALLTGLVSWWTVDETTGDRLDSHGSNDLSPYNSPSYTTGVKGNALACSSTNFAYRTHVSQVGLDITGSLTMACWVRTTANTTFQNIMGKMYNQSGYCGYELVINPSSQIVLRISPDGETGTTVTPNSGATTIANNTWMCVFASFDASTGNVNMWLDGSQVLTDSATGISSIFDSTNAFALGCRKREPSNAVNSPLQGDIDEAAVWNVALGGTEAALYYNSGAGVTYSEL